MATFDPERAHFVTERLWARPWDADVDAEAALAMYGDPEVVRFIGSELMANATEMRERLCRIIERNRKWPAEYGSWPLFERASGELVGTALLKPLPASGTGRADSADIEIGWHLARRHWGRGFATEAGGALLELGFVRAGLEVLHAVVESENQRSLAVARRLGMYHHGRTDRYYDLSLEHFSLRRAQWRS